MLYPCRTCRKPTPKPQCDTCRTNRYGAHHRAQRQAWTTTLHNTTTPINCDICHQPIDPHQPWDLHHRPDMTTHPTHAHCNRSAGASGHG